MNKQCKLLIIFVLFLNQLSICTANYALSPKSKLKKQNLNKIQPGIIPPSLNIQTAIPIIDFKTSSGIIIPSNDEIEKFLGIKTNNTKNKANTPQKIILPSNSQINEFSNPSIKNPIFTIFLPQNINLMNKTKSENVLRENGESYEFYIQKKLWEYIEKERCKLITKEQHEVPKKREFRNEEKEFLKTMFLLKKDAAIMHLINYCQNKDGYIISWALLSISLLKRNDFEDYIVPFDKQFYHELENKKSQKLKIELKHSLNWFSALYTKEGQRILKENHVSLPFLNGIQLIIKGIGIIDSDILLDNFMQNVSHLKNIYHALNINEKNLIFINLNSKTILEYEKIITILINESSLTDINNNQKATLNEILKLIHSEMEKAYTLFSKYFAGEIEITKKDIELYWGLYMAKLHSNLKEKESIEGIPNTDTLGLEYEYNMNIEYRTNGGTLNDSEGMNHLKSFVSKLPYILDGGLHIHAGRNISGMSNDESLALKRTVKCFERYWLSTLYLPEKTIAKLNFDLLSILDTKDYFSNNVKFEHSDIIHPEEENEIMTLEFKNLTPPESIFKYSGRHFSYLQDLMTIVMSLYYEITTDPKRFKILNMGNPLIVTNSPVPVDKLHLIKFLKFVYKNTPYAREAFMRIFEECNPSYTHIGDSEQNFYSNEKNEVIIKKLYSDNGLELIYEINKNTNGFFDGKLLEKLEEKINSEDKDVKAKLIATYLYLLEKGSKHEQNTAKAKLKAMLDKDILNLLLQDKINFISYLKKYIEKNPDFLRDILYILQFLDKEMLESLFSYIDKSENDIDNFQNILFKSIDEFIKSANCYEHNIIKLCACILNKTAIALGDGVLKQAFNIEFSLLKEKVISIENSLDFYQNVISPYVYKLDANTTLKLFYEALSLLKEKNIPNNNINSFIKDVIKPMINQLDFNTAKYAFSDALLLIEKKYIPNDNIYTFFQNVLIPILEKLDHNELEDSQNKLLNMALSQLKENAILNSFKLNFFLHIVKPLSVKLGGIVAKVAFDTALSEPIENITPFFCQDVLLPILISLEEKMQKEAAHTILSLLNNVNATNNEICDLYVSITPILIDLNLDIEIIEQMFNSFLSLLKNKIINDIEVPHFTVFTIIPTIQKMATINPKTALFHAILFIKDKSIPHEQSLDFFFGIINPIITKELNSDDAKELFDLAFKAIEEKNISNKKLYDFCHYVLAPIAIKLKDNELKEAFINILYILKENNMKNHRIVSFCKYILEPIAIKLGEEYHDFIKLINSVMSYTTDSKNDVVSLVNYFICNKAA